VLGRLLERFDNASPGLSKVRTSVEGRPLAKDRRNQLHVGNHDRNQAVGEAPRRPRKLDFSPYEW
jgi:hypothetical protein